MDNTHMMKKVFYIWQGNEESEWAQARTTQWRDAYPNLKIRWNGNNTDISEYSRGKSLGRKTMRGRWYQKGRRR